MSGNSDPLLIDISNAFYTGNYQQCINLAEKIKVTYFAALFSLPTHPEFCFPILEAQLRERHLHVPLIPRYQPLSCGSR